MKTSPGSIVLAVAAAVAGAAIIAGVILVGGPEGGRMERLDGERLEDLRGIMEAVDRFWTDHERLPATLEELAQYPRVRVDILDPGSDEPYEYESLGEDTYELCAVFDRESRAPRRAPADFWTHGAGRRCFELTAKHARGPGRSGEGMRM